MPKNILSTPAASASQPVRFYKFVALTFLFITLVLLGVVVFMSAKRAKIVITTKSDPVEVTFPISMSSQITDPVPSTVTTTLVQAEVTFHPTGTREESGRAGGMVTLYNDSNTVQPLVATTRLLAENGVLFRLTNGATVPAKGTLEAEVYADVEGADGDIAPTSFTIPGLTETRQKEVYAKSTQAMTGGVRRIGAIDEEDIKTAEKTMIEELEKKGKDVLAGAYADKKGVFKVIDHTLTADKEVGDETDAFVMSGTATVVGVLYSNDDMVKHAVSMLEKKIVDDSEQLTTTEQEPVVTFDQYDVATGTATINVSYGGLVDIDANSKDLQKIMFFGKTEDEVRRYVMSLDHVQSVDMNFRPLWNRTVPHVSSHVEVIVRKVQ